MLSLKTLFPALSLPDWPVRSLENDSRLCTEGSLFIAFTGFERDLHPHVPDAYARGCRLFAVADSFQPPAGWGDALFIPCSNLRAENARLARLFYGAPDLGLCIIGITGTNGKTTCASMIASVLEACGYRTAFFGTTHWHIGTKSLPAPNTTPDLLPLFKYLRQALDGGMTHVVMEAASHALALGRMDGLAIDGAVFTNLTQDHLDFHKDMDSYFLAKRALFSTMLAESPKPNKRAFINGDDMRGQAILRLLGERGLVSDSLSLEGKGSINAENIVLSSKGASFTVGGQNVKTSLIGRVNVANALAAYAVLRWLGLSPKKIIPALEEVSVKGRMEKLLSPDGVVFLIDYAHTPDALERALASAQSAKAEGSKLIVIFGAGGDRDRTKRPLMARASLGADIIIVTSDNPRTEDPLAIIEDVSKGFPPQRPNLFTEPDRRKALALARSLARSKDVILVAGKGHEEHQIIGIQKYPFSDREEIQKILNKTGY